MTHIPDELHRQLLHHGQEHVLISWDQLGISERRQLVDQLKAIDLAELRRLHAQKEQAAAVPDPERIEPVPVVPLGEDDAKARQVGEEALRRGEVAVLLVAGGQGSRLGFDLPKGMFPIGPVSNKTLFQIHGEKLLALRRRYGADLPVLVMTSPATHADTVAYGRAQDYFGLPREDFFVFNQGVMPALDLATGRLLLEAPGRLFLSPNGHGGTLTALAESGLLDRLRARGVRHVFYFQVDNPLVQVADPVFLGRHIAARSEVSSKVIAKDSPTEKMGNFVMVDGRLAMIEYSDLPLELARQTDEHGKLRIWAGNPAIHIFDVEFLERVTGARGAACRSLPFHVARKKVPCIDEKGRPIEPTKENALKFEMFIFDVLPLAERWLLVESNRQDEFAPLKNATGADSPGSVQRALTNLAARWLEQAGVPVPRRKDGEPQWPLEISPLHALDAAELAAKADPDLQLKGPTHLAP